MHVYIAEHHFNEGPSAFVVLPTTNEENAIRAGLERANQFGYSRERSGEFWVKYAKFDPPCELIRLWEAVPDSG